MVSEDAIRQRSYEIWQREGCQDGKAVEYWFRAKAELAAENRAALFPWGGGDCREIVVPRVPISPPPKKTTSRRVPRPSAARR
jgi:hypothetical protein